MGRYFVEQNFATATGLEFMALTNRNVKDFIVKAGILRRKAYIDTEKLLNDVSVDESYRAQRIGDKQKQAFLAAVNSYFATGEHPAFK